MTNSWSISEAWERPGWAVRRYLAFRATRIFRTKWGAINTAKRWGRRDKVSVYLHDNMGRVELLYPTERTLRRWLRAT